MVAVRSVQQHGEVEVARGVRAAGHLGAEREQESDAVSPGDCGHPVAGLWPDLRAFNRSSTVRHERPLRPRVKSPCMTVNLTPPSSLLPPPRGVGSGTWDV